MRKWSVPLTVLGLGGVGAFLFSETGTKTLRWLLENAGESPQRLQEWNAYLQNELDHIEDALNRIAESLEPHAETGN